MKNIIDTIRIFANKKKYIKFFRGFYENSCGARNHLRELMSSNAILSKFLKTDAEKLKVKDEMQEHLNMRKWQ